MRINKKLILSLNQPLSINKMPFRLMAKRIGVDEERFLSILGEYEKSGLIRRFGAILNHQKVGLKTNALLALKVERKRLNSVGNFISRFVQVSHCYLRTPQPHWPYNLYAMLHAPNRKAALSLIKIICRKTEIEDYKILFTLKEFKKAKPNLF